MAKSTESTESPKSPKSPKSNGKAGAGRNRLTEPESTPAIEPTSFKDMASGMRVLAYESRIELVKLRCHIVGLAPGFLQHSRRGMDPAGKAGSAAGGGESTRKKKLLTPEEMAELAAYYLDGDAKTKQLALPWRCLYNAMVTAAVNYKLSGNKTFMDTIAASIACEQDNIPLVDAKGKPIRKYVLKRDFAALAGDQLALRVDYSKARPTFHAIFLPNLMLRIIGHRMFDFVSEDGLADVFALCSGVYAPCRSKQLFHAGNAE